MDRRVDVIGVGAGIVGLAMTRALLLKGVRRVLVLEAEGQIAAHQTGHNSGVRVDRGGRLLDDFHIVRGERSLHVLNAPSPAATASLSIGARIADELVSGPALLVQSAS